MVAQIYDKVTIKKVKKIEEHENQVDELLGDLNPKYFEEAITLKEAKERITGLQNTITLAVQG